MVQDLPVKPDARAEIPHVLLAAHAGTIMGVESNGMQFYPEASTPEAAIHPGLFRRQRGTLDLSSIRGPGFGYRIDEIKRAAPAPGVCGRDLIARMTVILRDRSNTAQNVGCPGQR